MTIAGRRRKCSFLLSFSAIFLVYEWLIMMALTDSHEIVSPIYLVNTTSTGNFNVINSMSDSYLDEGLIVCVNDRLIYSWSSVLLLVKKRQYKQSLLCYVVCENITIMTLYLHKMYSSHIISEKNNCYSKNSLVIRLK